MVLFKWALLTCLFYLAIVAILNLAIFVAGSRGWVTMIGIRGWPLFAIFGIIWLISFYSAGLIIMAQIPVRPH